MTPELARALLAGFVRHILFSRSQTFATVEQLERSHEVRGVGRRRPCMQPWATPHPTPAHPPTCPRPRPCRAGLPGAAGAVAAQARPRVAAQDRQGARPGWRPPWPAAPRAWRCSCRRLHGGLPLSDRDPPNRTWPPAVHHAVLEAGERADARGAGSRGQQQQRGAGDAGRYAPQAQGGLQAPLCHVASRQVPVPLPGSFDAGCAIIVALPFDGPSGA
jgi:hypothetical protein